MGQIMKTVLVSALMQGHGRFELLSGVRKGGGGGGGI